MIRGYGFRPSRSLSSGRPLRAGPVGSAGMTKCVTRPGNGCAHTLASMGRRAGQRVRPRAGRRRFAYAELNGEQLCA
jgi:hypothetical protein